MPACIATGPCLNAHLRRFRLRRESGHLVASLTTPVAEGGYSLFEVCSLSSIFFCRLRSLTAVPRLMLLPNKVYVPVVSALAACCV